MDKSNEPESIESYLNRLSDAKTPLNGARQNSSKSWLNPKGITKTWLIVIIINAAIAFLLLVAFCYLLVKRVKRKLAKKKLINGRRSSTEPYFTRRAERPMARSVSTSSDNMPVYTIPINHNQQESQANNQKNNTNGGLNTSKSSKTKFRTISRVTGHILNPVSNTLNAGYDAMKQVESALKSQTNKSEDVPLTPAIYQPPNTVDYASLDSSDEESELPNSKEVNVKDQNKTDTQLINLTEPTNTASKSSHKDFLTRKEKALEEKMMQIIEKQESEEAKIHQEETSNFRTRLMSAGIQTSPTLWFGLTGTVNLKKRQSIEWEPHPTYSDPFSPSKLNPTLERRYFIYIVSESTPFFRKNCIGKITLPAGTSITLSELRDYLLKAQDNQLKDILKRNKSFRFLTETYRFVSQNEAAVPIDQVYPTQGIFIKLAGPVLTDNPGGGRRLTRKRREIEARRSSQQPTFIPQISQKDFSNSTVEKLTIQLEKVPGMVKDRLPRRVNFDQFDEDKKAHLGNLFKNRNRVFDASSNLRRKCSNSDCNKPGLLRCVRCSNVYYCSVRCKNEHRREHRMACSRPPWRF